ncbi:hypothetical protein AWB67_06198 [Caballeronia terrestris]|uniref:Uncharacterized protein n=1 Tax=Caballeronia terrestris TaxID=1226301 RepID=A0A158KNH1_9BURK|nr:hypothetical protein AWB67_06198 [Caballeronia terrestris]
MGTLEQRPSRITHSVRKAVSCYTSPVQRYKNVFEGLSRQSRTLLRYGPLWLAHGSHFAFGSTAFTHCHLENYMTDWLVGHDKQSK